MAKRSGSYVVPFSFELLSFDEAWGLLLIRGGFLGMRGPLLETVVDMLDELGRPDEYFDSIQVAGTNGKTSTTRFRLPFFVVRARNRAVSSPPAWSR